MSSTSATNQSTFFPIPSSWQEKTIGELFEISAGGDWDPAECRLTQDSDHRYSVYANSLSNSGLQGFCRYWKVPGNSLTITGRGNLGHALYRAEPFVPIVRLLSLVPREKLDSRFFAYFVNQIVRFSFESTGVPQLTAPQVKDYLVAVPPYEEQVLIANVISDAERAVFELGNLITKRNDIMQGAMQQLLTGKTRLPGFGGEWQIVQLGRCATFLKKLSLPRDRMATEGEISYLHYGDIHVGPKYRLNAKVERMPRIESTDQANATLLAVGDLVFVDASEDTVGVGKSVEITDVPERGLVAGLHTIAVRFDKLILADGFKAYLQEIPTFRAHMLRLAAGTKVLASTKSHIASAEILLPSTQEQQEISKVLSDMDSEIDALVARREKTALIKQGMMQELLTGRTRLV